MAKKIEKELGKPELGKPEQEIWRIDDVEKEASLELAVQLAKLPEEQRRQIIETYALLKQVEKGESSAILLPLLIGFTRTNLQAQQTTSPEVLLEIERLRTEREISLENIRMERELKALEFKRLETQTEEGIKELLKVLIEMGEKAMQKEDEATNVGWIRIKCVKCGKSFYADALAKYVVCAECGAVLEKWLKEEER